MEKIKLEFREKGSWKKLFRKNGEDYKGRPLSKEQEEKGTKAVKTAFKVGRRVIDVADTTEIISEAVKTDK